VGDYHVHLHPHGPWDGSGPPPGEYPPGHIEAYVAAAAARGYGEVAFTEHLYRCVEATEVLGEFWRGDFATEAAAHTARWVPEDRLLSLEGYVAAVTGARDGGLPVLLGLEVDFFPATIDAVLELLAPYPWDVLVGSVHWVGAWSVDHAGAVGEFARRGVRRAYEDYFGLETALAASGAVDVLAHVDVVKKMGHRLAEPPVDLYRPVVEAAAASGTAVEVSTAGLHEPAGELYPERSFLEMFHRAAVPITLASDAHRPEECARDFDVAVAAARAAGYTERLRFRRRVGEPVPL
jgi:histidinol-phosphatase (PHP family)